jgi:hypothetical protein
MIDLDPLRALLAQKDDARDRAFVDALLRMEWSRTSEPALRGRLSELHETVRAASLRSHAALRAQIAAGELRGAALRARFDQLPMFERDHLVEEVLGIAYPPLEEPELGPELLGYAPSGYDEIVHAFGVTELGPDDRFLDLGSGTGKAVILATLLEGATSAGVECSRGLHELAESASRALRLDRVQLHHGDAQEVADTDADMDVVFMYLPFTGSVLATVMARLVQQGRGARGARRRFLCAGPLDLRRYPQLVAAGPPRSWLHVYTWR